MIRQIPRTDLRSRLNILASIVAITLLQTGIASAQDLTPKAPPQTEPIALVGATIHTIKGPVIENGALIFQNGIITNVTSAATIRIPSTVRIIDVSGQHIYPGIIAAKTRLGLTEISAVRAMQDTNEVGQITPEVRACVSVNPDSTLIPVARTNGVLTALTLPTGGLVPGRASIIQTDGWTWEDMTITPDAALVINWPRIYQPKNRWTGKPNDHNDNDPIKTLTNLFAAARAYHASTDTKPDLALEALNPYITQGKNQKPIIANANTVDQITSAVHFANENNLRLIIMGGRDALLCAQLLKENKVPVILQTTHSFPARTDAPFDQAFTRPARFEAAGLTWCLAPSDIDANVRNLPYEAATAVAYGLDQQTAIRSITLAPAQILGLDNQLGSIEPQKAATLIVTDGPLLEISTNTTLAFINGRQVDLSNKQTKLRDKYLEKYRQLDILDK
jgi:imidazolonepropionase-like amidohydrolase